MVYFQTRSSRDSAVTIVPCLSTAMESPIAIQTTAVDDTEAKKAAETEPSTVARITMTEVSHQRRCTSNLDAVAPKGQTG